MKLNKWRLTILDEFDQGRATLGHHTWQKWTVIWTIITGQDMLHELIVQASDRFLILQLLQSLEGTGGQGFYKREPNVPW